MIKQGYVIIADKDSKLFNYAANPIGSEELFVADTEIIHDSVKMSVFAAKLYDGPLPKGVLQKLICRPVWYTSSSIPREDVVAACKPFLGDYVLTPIINKWRVILKGEAPVTGDDPFTFPYGES